MFGHIFQSDKGILSKSIGNRKQMLLYICHERKIRKTYQVNHVNLQIVSSK